jgi:hypothetical protein
MRDETAFEGYKPDGYAKTAAASKPEKDAMLPAPADPYKAAGTPDNGEISRLVLVMGKDGFKTGGRAYYFLQYVHISMGEFGFWDDGQFFQFVFSDIEPKLVTVRGRNLLRISDYISLHRLPWIRQSDRDFRGSVANDEPIITRIEVTDWKRKEQAAGTEKE